MIYFTVTLTLCSVITAVPQIHRPHTNFHSDDRIVNKPLPVPSSIANGILNIREEVRPGVSNQRHPQDGIMPQRINPTQNSNSSQAAFPRDPTTLTSTTTISSGNQQTQNHDTSFTTVSGSWPSSGNDSLLILREKYYCGVFPSPGECQGAFPRYYYNKTTGQCDCYLFGGCEEDVGSYRTFKECNQKCQPESKEEGPNCKFVFIDNFSPITPSTTLPTASTFPVAGTNPHAPDHPAAASPSIPLRPQSGWPSANRPVAGSFHNDSTSPFASRHPADFPASRRPASPPSIPPRPLSHTQSSRPIANQPTTGSFPSGPTLPHIPHPSLNHPQVNRRPTPSPTNLLRPENGEPSQVDSFFESDITSVLPTDTSRRPPEPHRIPMGSVSLPGGPIDVPHGSTFITMSSSNSRFRGESEEHERDVFA